MRPLNPIRECVAEIRKLRNTNLKEAATKGKLLVQEMLRRVCDLSEPERRDLVSSLARDETGLLFGIALGSAIDAVRQNQPAFLRDGLLALLIEDRREDYRQTVIHLCLLNHSANRIGVDLRCIYNQLRLWASREMASLVENWLREGSKDISMMGYSEGVAKDGTFTYLRRS